MKREILFRGKITENDEPAKWVYGGFMSEIFTYIIEKIGDTGRTPQLFMVDPETVGQFTGVYDKNGKPVFEGDIIVWDYDEVDFDGATHTTPELVKWDKDYCGFIVNYDGEGTIDKNCRVIGNIYDNPELLEEGEENAD